MNQTVENFYNKNSDQNYVDEYDTQHGSRIDWIIKKFGLEKLQNKRICDVGAGRGNFFKRLNPNNTFVGIDGAIIKNKLCNFLSLKIDLDYPFADILSNEEKFDFLICSETLEHLSGLDNCILEMKKLLKENHYAIFTIPHVSVTHPIIYPGVFYPEQNFKIFLEQYAWLVEEQVTFTAGWPTVCFLVRNAPMIEQKVLFPKSESKFHGVTPREATNL